LAAEVQVIERANWTGGGIDSSDGRRASRPAPFPGCRLSSLAGISHFKHRRPCETPKRFRRVWPDAALFIRLPAV